MLLACGTRCLFPQSIDPALAKGSRGGVLEGLHIKNTTGAASHHRQWHQGSCHTEATATGIDRLVGGMDGPLSPRPVWPRDRYGSQGVDGRLRAIDALM